MLDAILAAVYIMGGLGLGLGLALAVSARVFHVEKDPRLERILTALPGANCGGCGFPGCAGYAQALLESAEVSLTVCAPGGPDIISKLSDILDREAPATVRKTAYLRCQAEIVPEHTKYQYDGPLDCRAAVLLAGGPNACLHGCIGLNSCVVACPFNAITACPEKPPLVDKEKCTGCGQCVEACPKNLFTLEPEDVKVLIRCSMHEKGAVIRKLCAVGCISCGLCVKACEPKAIQLVNFLPVFNMELCTGCGACVARCPRKVIEHLRPELITYQPPPKKTEGLAKS
jgi:Na+-translocating ferredoxin:NAD+ oxidoreductase RNF subunit RnfB